MDRDPEGENYEFNYKVVDERLYGSDPEGKTTILNLYLLFNGLKTKSDRNGALGC